MSTPETNDKSINSLKEEGVNGNEILGGGKATPIIVAMPTDDIPMDVNIPTTVILPHDGNVDYAPDGNVTPNNDNLAPLL